MADSIRACGVRGKASGVADNGTVQLIPHN